MKIVASIVVVAALAAGCSHGRVAVHSTTTSVGASQGGSVHVKANGGAALLLLGAVAIASGDFSETRPVPDPRDLLMPSSPKPGPMAPDRRINEQDCTQPVDLTAGNLRCK
jgi:hypothetical protein